MSRDDIAAQLRQRADLMGQWLTPEQNIMLVAADEIDRLRGEVARLDKACQYHANNASELGRSLENLEHDYAAMKAERDAAVKDAERYRWLKQETYMWSRRAPATPDEQAEPVAIWVQHDCQDIDASIDAAIDAAMGEK